MFMPPAPYLSYGSHLPVRTARLSARVCCVCRGDFPDSSKPRSLKNATFEPRFKERVYSHRVEPQRDNCAYLIRRRSNAAEFAQSQHFRGGPIRFFAPGEFRLLYRLDALGEPARASGSMTNVDLGHNSDPARITLPEGFRERLSVVGFYQVDRAAAKTAAGEARAN
jgi:hypothetical protein